MKVIYFEYPVQDYIEDKTDALQEKDTKFVEDIKTSMCF